MKKKKSLSFLLSFVIVIALLCSSQIGLAMALQKESAEKPWVATPYHRPDGTVVEGLEAAVKGKSHWLEETAPMPVKVTETADSVMIGNGAIERTFKIPSKGGTQFYTSSYKNTYINKELLAAERAADSYFAFYDISYDKVYSTDVYSIPSSSPRYAPLRTHESFDKVMYEDTQYSLKNWADIKVQPDYFYVGGADSEKADSTFVFDSYKVFETCEKTVEWSPNPIYGDPAAEDWPPKGKRVEFNFVAGENFKSSYKDIEIKLIYEMYDNLAAMKKRVEVVNKGDSQVILAKLAPEVLNGNSDMDDLLHKESTYTIGAEMTSPIDGFLPCICGCETKDIISKDKNGKVMSSDYMIESDWTDSPFLELDGMNHYCYETGPAYELAKGVAFKSFDSFELISSTYWFESRSRERLGMYRKLFPWITDNPLTMHNVNALTKATIDHVAAAGFEMIIQSYGSDNFGQMLDVSEGNIKRTKELIDYAHSKGVTIGAYQAQYTLGSYSGGAEYGSNNLGPWTGNTPCMASAAFDDYWENFKYFITQTGIDCVEIDGPYPGSYCNNGHNHVNEDKMKNPDGSESTVGNKSNYAIHSGFHDSKVKQWENGVRYMTGEFRKMGKYVKVPAWYYLNGGNKCGIGYEEAAWGQPRHEQFIYGRQLMHNASYMRTMSMSWSHVPFSAYHSGGSDVNFTPFKDHKEDYDWVLGQYIGNGVTSDYRGPALYDDETLDIMKKWVSFYKQYRGIINSDMVHVSQAMYENDLTPASRAKTKSLDALMHANANNEGEKGFVWVYNQTGETRTETFKIPMYNTGLTNMEYPQLPSPGSAGKDVHSYGTYPPNYKWLPQNNSNYKMPDPTGESSGTAVFAKDGVDVKYVKIDSNGDASVTVTMQPFTYTYYAIYEPGNEPDITVEVGKVNSISNLDTTANTIKIGWDKNVELKAFDKGEPIENSAITVSQFNVYRDGKFIGSTMADYYIDTDLDEMTEHSYRVVAVASGKEGIPSDGLLVSTIKDSVKPVMTGAVILDYTKIQINFSERMDKARAENIANYRLSDNANVIRAVLGADERSVILTTSTFLKLKYYTLTVSGVTDISSAKNMIAENSQKTISFGYLRKFSFESFEGNKLIDSQYGKNGEGKNLKLEDKGVIGKAARFSAADNSYADLGSKMFEDLYSYAVSLWLNPSDLVSKQIVFSTGQEGYTSSDLTLYIEGGKLKFHASSTDDLVSVNLESAGLFRNEWNHIIAARSGNNFELYVNGVKAGSQTAENIGTPIYRNPLIVGAITNNAGGEKVQNLNGLVDEVYIYDACPNEDFILGEYYRSPAAFNELISTADSILSTYFTSNSFNSFSLALEQLKEHITQPDYSVSEAQIKVQALKQSMVNLEKISAYKDILTHYTMDEASGDVIKDGVMGRNAKMINSKFMRMGTPLGGGVYISEVRNNYGAIADNAISGLNTYSYTGWFKQQVKKKGLTNLTGSDLIDEYALAGKMALLTDSDNTFMLYTENGILKLDIAGQTLTADKEIYYEKTKTSGETRQGWNHFAVTREGNDFCLYLNGEQTASYSFETDVATSGGTLLIGAKQGEGSIENIFNGIVDEFAFFGNSLNQSEVNAFYGNMTFKKSTADNLAKGKVTSTNVVDKARLTDGKILDLAGKDTPWTARDGGDPTKHYIDLGAISEIDAASITHFYRPYGSMDNPYGEAGLRHFNDIIIQVSSVSDFSSGVSTIVNTDLDNSQGWGKGTDETWVAFELGNDIVLDKPVYGRYVRLLSSGYYLEDNTSWRTYVNISELEIYGRPLTGDLTTLKGKIDKAESLDLVSFTPETVAEFNEALKVAKNLFDTKSNDALAISAAIAELDSATAALSTQTFTVKFIGANGEELKEETVLFGQDATAPIVENSDGLEFFGWDKDFTSVTENLVVTAVFKTRHAVTFFDNDGKIYKQFTVYDGDGIPDAPKSAPYVNGYKFTGWDTDFTSVTGDLEIHPIYKMLYTVEYVGFGGAELDFKMVTDGTALTFIDPPKVAGYVFTGWDTEVCAVTKNMVVTAIYKKEITVKFMDKDNNLLKNQVILEGDAPIAPTAPDVNGYKFTGWGRELDGITENCELVAHYIKIHNVVFIDADGNELKREVVENGKSASAPTVPIKDGFTFKGWKNSFSAVTDNVIVMALFEKNEEQPIDEGCGSALSGEFTIASLIAIITIFGALVIISKKVKKVH